MRVIASTENPASTPFFCQRSERDRGSRAPGASQFDTARRWLKAGICLFLAAPAGALARRPLGDGFSRGALDLPSPGRHLSDVALASAPAPEPASTPLTSGPAPAMAVDPRLPVYDPKLDVIPPTLPAYDWQWIDAPSSACGNGSPTGMGLSVAPNSTRLALAFRGGGSCFSAATCYVANTASYLDADYNNGTFFTQHDEIGFWHDNPIFAMRRDPNSPFFNTTVAAIPYCTGDLYTGRAIHTYEHAPRETWHVGALNTEIFLRMLAAAFPQTDHVFLAGGSAGGFGALLTLEAAQQAFPGRTVDVLDDSGFAFKGTVLPSEWNSNIANGCSDCASDFSLYAKNTVQANPASFFGFAGYEFDEVLIGYFTLRSKYNPLDYKKDVRDFFTDLARHPNVRTFLHSNAGHDLFKSPDDSEQGVKISAWMRSMEFAQDQWKSIAPTENTILPFPI